MEDSDILRIVNLSKSFGSKEVLRDINFSIKNGELFGLIGMSGAGKTTLLQLIMGVLEPSAGNVYFRPEHLLRVEEGEPIYKSVFSEKMSVKKIFGFATQEPSFYPELSVRENLFYFGALYDLSKDIINTNIKTVLKLVGLEGEEDTPANNLSGGMQKRLDIACAIIHDPDILMLDEPTADLDPVISEQMWDLIKRINATGTTVIVASHFLHEVEVYCDRLAIIHNKKLIDIGSVSQLKKKYMDYQEIHIETIPARYEELIMDLKKNNIIVRNYENLGYKLIIEIKNPELTLEKILELLKKRGEKLIDLEIYPSSLKEIFKQLAK